MSKSTATTTSTTTTKPAALVVIPKAITTMTASQLKAIVHKAIEADVALGLSQASHGVTYAACAADLRIGIDTGLTNTAATKEYFARVDGFSQGVSIAFFKAYQGADKSDCIKRKVEAIKKGISRDNAKALWVNPKPEMAQSEVAKLAREKDAKRKEESRAIAAKTKELQKTVKAGTSPEEVEKEAKALVKAESREAREETKAAANDARILQQGCDMLAAFSLKMGEQCEVNVADIQLRIASTISAMKAIIPAV